MACPLFAEDKLISAANVPFSDIRLPIESLQEHRFKGTVQQKYDFSCGAAAISTLLTYYYETPVSEEEALRAMYKVGDQEKIRKEGFSLLDMKRYLATLGFRADGYRAPLDKLRKAKIPALILINFEGYLHFVVVKGIWKEWVMVGDPALGLRLVKQAELEEMWNGILFVIRNRTDIARNYFNDHEEWATLQQAPLRLGQDLRSLAGFMLEIRPNNYY